MTPGCGGCIPRWRLCSTPIAAPVIVGTRLCRGSAGSARGAASFLAETIITARVAGATGVLLARMDSAFDNHVMVSTCIRAGVHFSITTKQTRPVRSAINAIKEDALGSDRLSARDPRRGQRAVDLRLIVRRVKDKNIVTDQGELFPSWRYHAFITNSTLELVAAEKQHREHAIIEQINADLKDSALAHMPSASFAANAAWLTLAPIAHNLTRAAGCQTQQWKSWTDQRYPHTRNQTP